MSMQTFFTPDANFFAGKWHLSSDDMMAQMTGKMALVQKVEERHLLQHGEVNIDKAPHIMLCLRQGESILWQSTIESMPSCASTTQ